LNNVLMDNALGAAGFAVLVLDEADLIVDCTAPAAGMFGFELGDLIGKPVSAVLPLAAARSDAANVGAPTPHLATAQITGRDRSGRPVPLAVNLVGWTNSEGRSFSTVVLHDVAVEREAARILQNDLIQSDNAIRGANIGVFEYDIAAQTVAVSDIWRRMLEIGPDERIDVQLEWRSRVHPDDMAAAVEPIELCSADRVERASCEYRLRSRDASHWRWMRTDIAVAQRDLAGKPNLLVGAQTDITERKKTEEALRVSVERFRSAFDNAPIGKAIVGLDGAWLLVNPALCALLGYTEHELLSTNFQSLTHPDDLEADLGQLRLLVSGEISSYTIEKRYFRANGAIMWGMLSVGMVRNAEGLPDHFVSQVLDITEQRRLDELKSEFVSVVSHELRTPLTSILGALTLLSTYDDADFPDEVQRLLFIAKTNGDRLHHLINDILDFQKFSAKQMRFSLSVQRIAGLVEDTLMANLAAADKHGVRFSAQVLDRTLTGLVDPKRFHQVMANLLSNAAKFADRGSKIEVSAASDGASIRVSVTNSGPGIPAAFRDRVFKPFSQAGAKSDRRSGGTGLGLSITKQIVEQMGGEIGFDSVPDEKTTFWFTVRHGEDEPS
jgi:PAS domain S-box-containing protein